MAGNVEQVTVVAAMLLPSVVVHAQCTLVFDGQVWVGCVCEAVCDPRQHGESGVVSGDRAADQGQIGQGLHRPRQVVRLVEGTGGCSGRVDWFGGQGVGQVVEGHRCLAHADLSQRPAGEPVGDVVVEVREQDVGGAEQHGLLSGSRSSLPGSRIK